MRPSYTYTVRPRLPDNLRFLAELAGNIWWEWNYNAIDLFRRISRQLWDESGQNPIYVLVHAEQERINYLSREEGFLSHLDRVKTAYDVYMQEPRWFQRTYPENQNLLVGYFSAEFGLSSCLPIYSGGLGILAGDHLKTASDMGLPLVAVGLAYRVGYFHQYLNIDGWQQERYDENDFYNLPIQQVRDAQGAWITFDVPYLGRPVKAALWRINVGRVPLLLLTTNLPQNRPEDRIITDQLYGGDREMRVRQEIVLGIGGRIALHELGYQPTVFHMNEGHSAFLALQRIRYFMQEQGLSFNAAFEVTMASNVFTTHTPVPAGNDVFTEDLLRKYLQPLADDLRVGWEPFMALGRDHQVTDAKSYCMTVTAIRCAARINGVSKLHGTVSRAMWQSIWPELPREEVPIRPITNGVHLYSWLNHDLAALFDRYLGPQWRDDPLQTELWHRVYEIPDEELWRTHETRRSRLVAFTRQHMEKQMASRGVLPEEIANAAEVLNPEALTIGFARRFATYKRAYLLFRDVERLTKLLGDRQRPVQFIFAGKAHPRDDEGKKVIRQIVHAVREEGLRFRFVFLEDYDMTMARYMVQGVDVWLNTPRRPLEASGTSGMKAVANGALHLSVLDGWWAQAHHNDYGWAIGSGEEYADLTYQDEVEGNALYDLLEKEITPLFFKRTISELPREWIQRMKRSMANLIPRFCSHRMVRNYIDEAYLSSDESWRKLSADGFARATALAGWRTQVEERWPGVKVVNIEVNRTGDLLVGEQIDIRASVDSGGLGAGDLRVEVYSGQVDTMGNFQNAIGTQMTPDAKSDAAKLQFLARLTAPQSGFFGFTVRVFPTHPDMAHKYVLYRVIWAES